MTAHLDTTRPGYFELTKSIIGYFVSDHLTSNVSAQGEGGSHLVCKGIRMAKEFLQAQSNDSIFDKARPSVNLASLSCQSPFCRLRRCQRSQRIDWFGLDQRGAVAKFSRPETTHRHRMKLDRSDWQARCAPFIRSIDRSIYLLDWGGKVKCTFPLDTTKCRQSFNQEWAHLQIIGRVASSPEGLIARNLVSLTNVRPLGPAKQPALFYCFNKLLFKLIIKWWLYFNNNHCVFKR